MFLQMVLNSLQPLVLAAHELLLQADHLFLIVDQMALLKYIWGNIYFGKSRVNLKIRARVTEQLGHHGPWQQAHHFGT